MIGILGYGVYVTRAVAPAEPADEDTLTLAVAAAERALAHADVPAARVGGVYVGHGGPLPVLPAVSSVVAEALGVSPQRHCADVHNGRRSGSAAFFTLANLVKPSAIELGLAIAVDPLPTSSSLDADASAADVPAPLVAAVALLVGRQEDEMRATIDLAGGRVGGTLPDSGAVPRPARHDDAFETTLRLVRDLMARKRLQPADFAAAAFQEPGRTRPSLVGLALGFTEQQLGRGEVGPGLDPGGTAWPLVGLAGLLDTAAAGQRLLVCSYGGAEGADAFVLAARPRVTAGRDEAASVRALVADALARAAAPSPVGEGSEHA
jgi:hydroxymethylglutaryl-CoA synthase